ncbi:hypothetical protein [Spirosoma telluris]|uniref:tetratricopeptide repeat protein n=1 Tax=Spirosoma telluris TaxID=2183553 RepID=UPI002FC32E47
MTRIQEPEPVSSFVGADSSRVNEQMNSITPDGSFRPVVHPASTDNSGKKSAWLLYAVIVLALLVGGTIWWLQDKPTDNVLETKTSEVAPESESTFESITKADSYYETGTHYFFGRNGKPQDYKLAAESYQKAADLGNSNGQSALGFLYQMGLGVEQSYEKAIKLFQASADQGNPEGQKNLGVIYYNGLGVPQDYARALKLFQASAAQGNAEGEVNLGVMYEQGQVVAKDPKAAFTWYMRAANQNLPLAEYYVGLGFQYGTGTEQSYNKAIQWYKQASLHGSKEAKLALKKMQ